MPKIKELEEVLADQIAAGEVVERPASVVKELVENAIDAKSTQIDIVVAEAGLKQIKVIDNGEGIPANEVELAFRRHSTSKITSRDDLFRIKTLGFRGEALPSIASVADVSLETKTADAVSGVLLHVKGGEQLEKKSSVRPQGTEIIVNDLFYNTPARLKYLKSLQTELAAISDIVNRLALSHNNIAISLTNNGRVLLQTVGNGDVQQTISAIYGVKNARQMIAFNGKDLDFKIRGYVSLPKLTRATKSYISLLLNGRYIKNFQLSNAIIRGYGSKLMVGRYPVAVVDMTLDPLLVDVNVHPTKQQVRISKEEQLAQLLTKSVYDRIAQENLIPDALKNLNQKTRKDVNIDQLQIDLNESSRSYYHDKKRVISPPAERVTSSEENLDTKYNEGEINNHAAKQAIIENVDESTPTVTVVKDKNDLKNQSLAAWDEKYLKAATQPVEEQMNPLHLVDQTEQAKGQRQAEKRFPELTYVGQMHGTYLFAESQDGLYIIDQHAAQERCKYEYYRKKIGEVNSSQQDLLVPIVLDYMTSDALVINENLSKFKQLGIELEEFGPNSYIIRHHPTWFQEGQEEETIRELIDYVLKDGKIDVATYREKTAIMMSCKRSIKANHHLDDKQAKALLEQLKKCENPFNCPHGRPVLVHFTNSDMEHMFKRIQDPHQSLREQS
ncbi:DNA mismatch repair endonuclease MutL [Liquorilactobacillus capillatus]|uniref:DNA mismatch repair protein MutL n=1 Tax=Liquorilactobacillus capillatus DSM 19910 TaxID=1423731 RepID=A0A0R1M4L9_9LACO|nr:DNA mismatch repair endonuclease MutL [Liquorilactobacillus capillatus]KRL03031.1 DNA mismatch repair protein [Liquorilactobacillus capillatus DSM 19910]